MTPECDGGDAVAFDQTSDKSRHPTREEKSEKNNNNNNKGGGGLCHAMRC